MARSSDQPFGRGGQRGDGASAPTATYRYRVRSRRRPSGFPRGRPSAERDATERKRLVARLKERSARLKGLGNASEAGRGGGQWTAARIVAVLRDLAESLGHTPTMAELGSRPRSRWPSPALVRTVFGSWNAALAAAALPLNATDRSRRPVWSDEDILRAIRDAGAAGEPGQGPFGDGRRQPWLATIVIRFGSWSVAESLALGSV